MGAVMSRIGESKQLKQKIHKWWNASWWLGGNLLWTTATAAIVLAIPVFFEYERECQMFEQMQQMQAAQMNQANSAL